MDMSAANLPRWYRKWSSMIQRCYNPKHPAYKYYGGKGIEVCDRWRGKGGSHNFLADMGIPPEELTLGRMDHAKDYCPENCRWETWEQQWVTRSKGGPRNPNSLRQKAIRANLPYHVVYQRVRIHFWPLELALSEPVRKRGAGSHLQQARVSL